jgi:LPXTG-site transpeptidase (sortase) family protein
MQRTRDVSLVHRVSRFIHLPVLAMLLFSLVTVTGDSVWPERTFPGLWRLSAQAAPQAAAVWKPGRAKALAYQHASPTRVLGGLGQWDDGVAPGPNPETTISALSNPSDLEPILPAILRAGLRQFMAAPVREAMGAPVLKPTATRVAQEPVVALAIKPEPSLTIPQLPPASSAPVRVVAPAIDLDQTVLTVGWHQETIHDKLVSVWDVAQYAVGWHKNSKYPGQGGNVVLAGHNNIYGEVFRRLEDLHVGDVITVYADGRSYDYAMESRVIVKEEGATPAEKASNARWIGSFPDERLTLVACYPYTGNSHRIIIIAEPRFKVSQ